ncbi:MAG TPA: MFS transporter [Clostridia bacterium]|nr:MAG: Major Facilitator Superfamily protein [Firmicutes bacterium ADurb.Bin146]HOD92900.1 MFS transporter [Clostridia bacterium]HQM39150.1 MFS transporter [Clostridia bacterium]
MGKSNLVISKSNPLGGKIWFSFILFGLVGQLTWAVENSYFSTYIQQTITAESWATSLTVIFSAIFAATATILSGALMDRLGKRRPFVCYGYILWGIITMAFAFFGNEAYTNDAKTITLIVIAFVAMDSIMSFVGSMANDAAFSAWVTDVTDITNRAFVDTIGSIFPLIAMVIILVGFSGFANSGQWTQFFAILGAIPAVSGIIGLFIFQDSPNLKPSRDKTYINQIAYGFKWKNVKENKMIYICFLGMMFSSIGMQIWMPYMISIIIDTLQVDYVVSVVTVILASAGISLVAGKLMDKYGKDKFYYPVALLGAVGGIIAFFTKYTQRQSTTTTLLLIIGGTFIMASSLMMAGLFNATARDYIPEGRAGCFQGIKMILVIMMPMVLASLIAPIIINTVALKPTAEFLITHPTYINSYLYPHELFLWAGLITLVVMIPAFFVKKDAKNIRIRKLEELNRVK